jgi:HSP20 family molecular chaperone IbpA
MEIAFGPFERSVRLSIPFERQGISANLEDGFLVIAVPKRTSGPRRIEVEPK